ncbi:aldo/keto reductase, partial [Bacillus cereus]|uniref:aldo/keto reductase n=1 Tax=Bacillus cereus TaxID=1396 RepID=UPI00283FE934
INLFGTADLYDYGLNEEFGGKVMKGKRDQIVLTTKVGNSWTEEKNGWSWDPSKAYILTEVKESLRRLQTDYIELYQLHGRTIE